MAHHDGLTGLANRTYFTEYLELGLQAAERKKSSLAVLFLDLDQFKSVNDTLGHRVGDQLLEAVANRMKAVIRDNDVLSRISGDEFVFLLQDIQNEQDIQIATERVMGAFAEPFSIEDNMLKLTASIGISVYPRDTENAQQLMQHADAAMYNAKEEGRNTYRFFTSEMSKAVAEDAVIGSALAMALGNEELGVHYQPQIDLNEGNVVGLEALVRWNNPRLGQVPPDRFIPVAEQRGLMVEIGNFVLRTACRQGQSWRDAGIGPFKIAVNVSGLQFQSVRYLADLQAILDETGFPPEWLELELTESILMKRTEALVSLLNALSGMGIGIAIDDFGTGYSSLSYLSKLPVDKLKVDKQFVRDVLDDENDAALAASIIAMGRALDIDVVAEGVETTQQAEFLRAHGCKLVQGYLYGRPMPADDLAEHLHAIASAERDPR